MNQDQGMNTLYLALCLMLVASSLVGMRLPLGKVVRMMLAWVAIFGVGFILFSFRGEFSALGAKLRAEATGAPIQSGDELRIAKRDDGHFWVTASINGQDARFLVDSGASITTISSAVAGSAGVVTGMRVSSVATANGEVLMRRASVDRFEVGTIERRDFGVHVNEHDDTNVLGMNFLSSLDGWRVEGNTLVLRP